MAAISTKKDKEMENEGAMEDKEDPDPNEPDPADNPYYFESDHAALKCNPDYHNLLKTLCLLEAQRIRAIKDIDLLYMWQKEALENPLLFVEKLQQGNGINFPRQQIIAKLPSINWEAYTSRKDITPYYAPKHMTRKTKNILDSCTVSTTNGEDNSEGGWKPEYSNTSRIVVRGRLKNENKPTSFNQLWSIEEQKRLEELLVKYPPEEVESRRWQKIAVSLGNRTTQQVASRVQKYFIKLARAGLPVPGRTPNLTSYTRRTGHRHHRFNRFYHQSTFLQAHEPPVYMSDDDDDSSMSVGGSSSMEADAGYGEESKDVSDEESIPPELRDSEEYEELMKLKKIKMTQFCSTSSGAIKSPSFKCDNCQCTPITNTRWQCIDCQNENGTSIDLCNNCIDSNFENSFHNSSHRFQPVTPQGFVDNDYTKFSTGDYNYLDPNYMPAN